MVAHLRGRPLRVRDLTKDQNDRSARSCDWAQLALVVWDEVVGVDLHVVPCSLLRGIKHRRERVHGLARPTESEAKQRLLPWEDTTGCLHHNRSLTGPSDKLNDNVTCRRRDRKNNSSSKAKIDKAWIMIQEKHRWETKRATKDCTATGSRCPGSMPDVPARVG